MDEVAHINAYLREHIPITQPLGARLLARDANGVRLAAPLEPNFNHQETAFGGSIACLAILAGWTLLNFDLRDAGLPCRLVIQRSTLHYLAPIEGDFEATARAPDTAKWSAFLVTLRRRKRARITSRAEIWVGETLAARHDGVYVAFQ